MGIDASSADQYSIDASKGEVMSLNYGQIPGRNGNGKHAKDMRVIMYVDHAAVKGNPDYKIRTNAALSNAGYYSATSKFGVLAQGN